MMQILNFPAVSLPDRSNYAIPMIKVTPITSSATTIPTTSTLTLTSISPNAIQTITTNTHCPICVPYQLA